MQSEAESFQVSSMSAGRGRGAKTIDESRFLDKSLLPRQSLLRSASSKSTLENEKRAKKLLLAYAVKRKAPDPFQVNTNSSTLILNLLTEYCKMNSPDLTSVLRNNSMGYMIQGLD